MSETSPNLGLPLVMPAQAQKHVTVNEALLRLDALVQAGVESRSVSVQPEDVHDGGCWILPDGATGSAWSAMAAGSLAVFRDGFWTEIPPEDGWRVHVRDEQRAVTYSAGRGNWFSAASLETLCEGSMGGATAAVLIEAEAEALSGSTVVTGAVIPARSVVFCVSVTTVEAISGATSFDCGIAGETSKFGGLLGVSPGAGNIGVIGPTAFYADTPVRLTANGGDFSGGKVRLAVHAWLPSAPSA